MPVRFTNEATVINPPPSPRNSPRSSVTPRTRQSGKESRSRKTHTSGRKRKTKVKNAKKSKRGSQKKRGRRASKRQRGGEKWGGNTNWKKNEITEQIRKCNAGESRPDPKVRSLAKEEFDNQKQKKKNINFFLEKYKNDFYKGPMEDIFNDNFKETFTDVFYNEAHKSEKLSFIDKGTSTPAEQSNFNEFNKKLVKAILDRIKQWGTEKEGDFKQQDRSDKGFRYVRGFSGEFGQAFKLKVGDKDIDLENYLMFKINKYSNPEGNNKSILEQAIISVWDDSTKQAARNFCNQHIFKDFTKTTAFTLRCFLISDRRNPK